MSTNKKQQQFKAPFCKVCFDAGKTEKEYTSHYVRSDPGPNSKVVCPTLLSLSCGYCGNCGHTPKFCPTLSSNKKTEAKQMSKIQAMEKRELEEKNANKKKVQVQANKFAAFDDDDDSDSETEQTLPQVASKVVSASFADFPALAAPATKKQTLPAIKKIQPKSNILSALSQVCPEVSVAAKMPEVYIPKPVMSKLDRGENKEEFIERYMKEATSTKGVNITAFYEEALTAYNKSKFPASTADWAAWDEESDDEEAEYADVEEEDW